MQCPGHFTVKVNIVNIYRIFHKKNPITPKATTMTIGITIATVFLRLDFAVVELVAVFCDKVVTSRKLIGSDNVEYLDVSAVNLVVLKDVHVCGVGGFVSEIHNDKYSNEFVNITTMRID